MVAALPVAWMALNTINDAKSLLKANPMLASRYTANVQINVILLPRVSLSGPHRDGASPWNTM